MRTTVKFFVLFAFFALASAASTTWGVRNFNDSVVQKWNVVYPPKYGSQPIYFDIPQSYESNNKVISVIYVLDQFTNSSGPINELSRGGPGWTYAQIQMKNQPRNGINVTILVYGQ